MRHLTNVVAQSARSQGQKVQTCLCKAQWSIIRKPHLQCYKTLSLRACHQGARKEEKTLTFALGTAQNLNATTEGHLVRESFM